MEFRILGHLDVRNGDQVVELASGKQRALLALLILNANETVPTDRIVEELWGERSPQTAPKVIQNHVSQLRRGLGDGLLVTEGSGYRLRVEQGTLDVDRFEALLAEGRNALERGDADAAAELLREALALWRGSPLADVAFEPFAQAEIARLEERRAAAVEERVEADLVLGRHADLVAELESLIAKHPLRERLRGQLMLALYRSGRQSEALSAYQEARGTLVGELGIEPGRPLRDLHQAILNQDPGLELARPTQVVREAPRGAFVGREAELAELLAGLDDALAGRGRLFLLVGEPGIGKSRLAEELIARSTARGVQALVGRCWEAGGAPAYWPWVQSLRAYVRGSDPDALRSQLGDGAAYLAQIVPEVRRYFPELAEPVSLESKGDRFRLFDAAAEFLRDASEAQPLLFVLDDLHAADTASLLLLRFLARELGSMRILLVGAYRDVDPIPGRPLTELLAELAREPVSRRLALAGLSEGEVAEYVELTTTKTASPELVATVYGETEGNPLFVGEVVRLFSIEGADLAEPTIEIPQSVRDVIARRLTHLSGECKRILRLASVLGREFAVDALARLGRLSEEELLDTLDEAMMARIVTEVPGAPGRLRFAHVLIRDTLYEGVTPVRRIRMHREAIEALEALYGEDPGPHLAELAHHAIAGSEFEKALRYAQRAGDRAFAHFAYEESAHLYETALDALTFVDPDDEAARCELLLSRGEAEARAGNTPAAKRAVLDAAAIARRVGLPRELGRAAAAYGGGHMWSRAGADSRLVPLLEESLAALGEGEEEDVVLQVRLRARLAGALRNEHSRDRRDALSKQALEMARRAGSVAALVYALDGRSAAIIGPDTVSECLALANELRDVSERSGDLERVAYALDHRRAVLVMVGDLRSGETDLVKEIDIAAELGQPPLLWQAYAARAMFVLAAGRLPDAEQLIPEAFAFGERSMPETAIPVFRLQQYALADFRGRLAEVVPSLTDLAAEFPARVAFRCVLGHSYARLGQLSEAHEVLAAMGEEDFSSLPFDQEWLWGMSLLAETAMLLDDVAAASILYELLIPWAALNAADYPEGIRGSMSRYLGQLATTAQRWADAERHFIDAVEMNTRMEVWPWLAYTQYDYAQMLLERGEAGDAERAEELRASTKLLSDDMGLAWLAERVSAID